MKYKDDDERQKKKRKCPKFSGKSAVAAAGIWMLALAVGCSGQRDGVAGTDALEDTKRAEEATEQETSEKAAAESGIVETEDMPEETRVEGAAETAEETTPKEEWKEAYLNSLRTGEINHNEETLPIREIDFFVPAYIDDDEIPELFFYYYSDPALLIYDPNDGFTWFYFGRNQVFWQERTGNIVMYFDYISGNAYLTEFHLTEGKLEIILTAIAENPGDGLIHDWNEEGVSEEEFAARRDNLLGQMTHNLFDEDIVSYSFEELCGILEGQPEGVADSEELLDAFLANEIPAITPGDERVDIYFDDLPMDADEWYSYSVGERIDLDNDGENELVLNGSYGGMYLDAREGKVYVFAEGGGMSLNLSYTRYDDAVWIVYSDTLHGGRKHYWLTRYDGGEHIVDEFTLSAEYWDSPDFRYDENSDFTFRDRKISMEEYEALYEEIFKK